MSIKQDFLSFLGRKTLAVAAWLLYRSMSDSWRAYPRATHSSCHHGEHYSLEWELVNNPRTGRWRPPYKLVSVRSYEERRAVAAANGVWKGSQGPTYRRGIAADGTLVWQQIWSPCGSRE